MCLPRSASMWSILCVSATLFILAAPHVANAQRRRGPDITPGVYKSRIVPNWFANNTKFWYRNDLKGGAKEFILVDTTAGTRLPAFDHTKLAASLSTATGNAYASDHLPFSAIEFSKDGKSITFKAATGVWSCDLSTYAITKTGTASASPLPSADHDDEADLSGTVDGLAMVDPLNIDRLAADDLLPPMFQSPQAQSQATEAQGEQAAGRRGRGARGGRPVASPDGKWIAEVNDQNIYIHSLTDPTEIPLSTDGTAKMGYENLQWSPDSTTLVAFRVEPGDHKVVYRVESSPAEGGRAVLHTDVYPQAGDKFDSWELNLFDIANRKQIKPAVERIDFGPGGGDPDTTLDWNADKYHFSYEKVDRGHQRLRLIEVDAHTGDTRTLIDEKTDTFIWTAHAEALTLSLLNWMTKTDEVIYVSERDGWRQLYLLDMKTAALKQITKGNFVVRGIERIDEDNRQIWFSASGMNPDQDPYFVNYYRVNFDGTGFVALTDGNGTHSVTYSPDGKFLIDTYSRVDMPPVNELRRVSDGTLVTKLEEADITELKATGWEPPEVFVAKGRDGKTDIWGIISRPNKLDPSKKYPVLESIYNGPQSAYVPKSFSGRSRCAALNNLGFIVVQCDAMGTALRSKAFHDVCWHNLGDAGFPDRILWQKAIGAKYPYYDLTRVGIYGTSAGGQNAAGAVLFHPEFYKAAVANSGCHDNRIDKASWNEQWMGYPVGPQYSASSNIDNAGKLGGFLQLVVGEMDSNVPTESTYRFVDALIKANKDFDLVVVPGANHGAPSRITERKLEDFFLLHLQGVQAPDRNAANLHVG